MDGRPIGFFDSGIGGVTSIPHILRMLPEESVIFFGDTDHDFACARDAGCDFALADWKNRGWQDIPARYKFSGADEMEAILLRPSSAGL